MVLSKKILCPVSFSINPSHYNTNIGKWKLCERIKVCGQSRGTQICSLLYYFRKLFTLPWDNFFLWFIIDDCFFAVHEIFLKWFLDVLHFLSTVLAHYQHLKQNTEIISSHSHLLKEKKFQKEKNHDSSLLTNSKVFEKLSNGCSK